METPSPLCGDMRLSVEASVHAMLRRKEEYLSRVDTGVLLSNVESVMVKVVEFVSLIAP